MVWSCNFRLLNVSFFVGTFSGLLRKFFYFFTLQNLAQFWCVKCTQLLLVHLKSLYNPPPSLYTHTNTLLSLSPSPNSKVKKMQLNRAFLMPPKNATDKIKWQNHKNYVTKLESTLSTSSLISPSFQGGPTIFHKGKFLKHTPFSKIF